MVWRSCASTGTRKNLTTPMGINSIKDCFKRVNARLPEDHQVKRPSVHGMGRRTHITTSVNIGTDPSIIAYTYKHKDPKTLAKKKKKAKI